MLLGVDVSHHQNPADIDWDRFYRAGVRYVIARATYGVSQDATFIEHVTSAAEHGILFGAYHFLRFKESQPAESQAEEFLDAIAPLSPQTTLMLPPVIDLEDNRHDDTISSANDRRKYLGMVADWLQIVEDTLDRRAMIYTRASFFDDILGSPAGYGIRPLWVAHYTSRPSPILPEAWRNYTFWQYTETGRIPGFNYNIDLNRFDGTEEELNNLTQTTTLIQPDPPDLTLDDRSWTPPIPEENRRRVVSEGLSFRSKPQRRPDTFIVGLPLGHTLSLIEDPNPNDGWAAVRTIVDGLVQDGYVSRAFIRSLSTPAVEALVDAAIAQWLRFARGRGAEGAHPYRGYVGEMWNSIGFPNRDGRSPYAWSAAGMSYFVRQANDALGTGAYDDFQYGPSHESYIRDSIIKRDHEDAPFWGYRLDEESVEVGDFVCTWYSTVIDYDRAGQAAWYPSHTDVVVGVRDGEALAIGANIGTPDSVSTRSYSLRNNGKLDPNGGHEVDRRTFALMKNRR